MRIVLSCLFSLSTFLLAAQIPADSLTLLFMGDIMGHDSQIRSARQADSVSYDYHSCFKYIQNEISLADIAIANLEVTLAGPPYKGYPQFSSPDALAVACKDAGMDVLVTANNHCLDRGKSGLRRTINVLDSLRIPHTGTFISYDAKDSLSPLIIEKNNFKIALVNYTYGTNGIPVPPGVVVNINQMDSLKHDIEKAKSMNPDAIILFIHWGIEYQKEPNAEQVNLAAFCFNQGVNIIIGSHPHVIQKSIFEKTENKNRFVVYSLGNFISNQKTPGTDGGQMVKLKLSKRYGIATIDTANYILTWIYGPYLDGQKKFFILPCRDFENNAAFFNIDETYQKMKLFINESRTLLNSGNQLVNEKN